MNEYKRLTEKSKYGTYIIDNDSPIIKRLGELEDKIEQGKLVEWKHKKEALEEINKLNAQLFEISQKIEQGLLVELPCKVGAEIFFIYDCCSAEGKECIACDKGCVHSITHQEDGIWIYARYESGLTYWHKEEDFGKTVFLTKAEAEKRLAELRGGE